MRDDGLDERVRDLPVIARWVEVRAVEPPAHLLDQVLAVLPRSTPVASDDDRLPADLARAYVGLLEPVEDLPIVLLTCLRRGPTTVRRQVILDPVEGRDDVFDLSLYVLL